MISLLFSVLVACLVVGVFYWVITMIPLPPPARSIAMVVCALIFLIWMLNIFGVVGSAWRLNFR